MEVDKDLQDLKCASLCASYELGSLLLNPTLLELKSSRNDVAHDAMIYNLYRH